LVFKNHPVVEQKGNQFLLYDASFTGKLTGDWLDSDYWQDKATIEPAGLGRGSAWFISTSQESYVLRHYRRGGLVAHFSTDRYLWTGIKNTRAWREWNLLAQLYSYRLPAPVPVAARVIRSGLFYTADILTIKLNDTMSLSAYLKQDKLSDAGWKEIGKTIRSFHLHQIYHADLNAHNILLDKSGSVSLIDFDKGCVKAGNRWYTGNLNRLHRSLVKLGKESAEFHFNEANWQQLFTGYQAEADRSG
jgi:3-deoxy-D-manno-octulosonic acid kinase